MTRMCVNPDGDSDACTHSGVQTKAGHGVWNDGAIKESTEESRRTRRTGHLKGIGWHQKKEGQRRRYKRKKDGRRKGGGRGCQVSGNEKEECRGIMRRMRKFKSHMEQ